MYRGKTKKICLSNYGLTPIKIKYIWKSVFEGCNSKNPDLILITSLMRLDVSGCFTSSTSLLIDFLNHLGEISTLLATVCWSWMRFKSPVGLQEAGKIRAEWAHKGGRVIRAAKSVHYVTKQMCNRNIHCIHILSYNSGMMWVII